VPGFRLTLLVVVALAPLAQAAPQIGNDAPAFELPGLDGASVRGEALRGRVLVVDFFATWCGPCHQAIAALDKIVRGKDVQLVIVDVGEDPATVRAFFASSPPPAGARVALDRSGAVARSFGQNRFPTTFLIDAGGAIRHINRGYGSGYAARIAGWLAAMLSR